MDIHQFLSNHDPLFDVRSPSEYLQGHIPNALSLPLFTDKERAVVGTAYKQESRENALLLGLDFFGPKLRSLVESVISSLPEEVRTIRLYCWRGGMRSEAVAWLLSIYGLEVYTLIGGYKAFRQLVLQPFEEERSFIILAGLTGTGKTQLLNELSTLIPFLDFEGLANHKGSAFGHLGEEGQPSQEMFENLTIMADVHLRSMFTNKPVIIEDESQRIGTVAIPRVLWNHILRAPILFIELPFEVRLERIYNEYAIFPPEELVAATSRISKRLGPQHAKEVILLIQKGELKAAFEILLRYYDRTYHQNLEKRINAYPDRTVVTVRANTFEEARLLIRNHLL